jgi:hypothetical protein
MWRCTVSDHRTDVLSLLAGVVFASFGFVGLLHAVGLIDDRAPVWVVVVGAGALGLCGIGLSLRSVWRDRDERGDDHGGFIAPGSGGVESLRAEA